MRSGGRGYQDEIGDFIKEGERETAFSPPCEDREKAAVYKPGRELSPGTELAATSVLD